MPGTLTCGSEPPIMSSDVHSEIIDPSTLDAIRKHALIDELHAAHAAIFDGVDKADFAAYVVDSPAERTRIQVLRSGGRVIGYQAIHTFVRELDGERWIVMRAEAGKLPEYRRCAKGSLLIAEILRACLRYPGARKALLGCFVHPSAYLALGHVAPELYPHPQRATPPVVRRTMHRLADVFGLEHVDAARSGVRKVGWITRESVADRSSLARREDPWTRFYLGANPKYGEGHGLVVFMPLGLGRLIRGSGAHLWRTIERRISKPTPALEAA